MNVKILIWKYHLKSQKIPTKENLVVCKRLELDFPINIFSRREGHFTSGILLANPQPNSNHEKMPAKTPLKYIFTNALPVLFKNSRL